MVHFVLLHIVAHGISESSMRCFVLPLLFLMGTVVQFVVRNVRLLT